jgi:hypothetical protein
MRLFRSEILIELWRDFPASSKPSQQYRHPNLICSDFGSLRRYVIFYADSLDLARHIDAHFLRRLAPVDSPDPLRLGNQWSDSDLLVQPLEETHHSNGDCC